MAILRRIGGPKQVVIAIQVFHGDHTTAVADPAVDVEKSDLDAYLKSDFDTRHIVYLEGQKPSLFTIQAMTSQQKDAEPEDATARTMAAWRWRCAVTAHSNYHLLDAQGREVAPDQPDRVQNGDLGMVSSSKWIASMEVPAEYLHALARMIAVYSEATGPLPSRSDTGSGDTEK